MLSDVLSGKRHSLTLSSFFRALNASPTPTLMNKMFFLHNSRGLLLLQPSTEHSKSECWDAGKHSKSSNWRRTVYTLKWTKLQIISWILFLDSIGGTNVLLMRWNKLSFPYCNEFSYWEQKLCWHKMFYSKLNGENTNRLKPRKEKHNSWKLNKKWKLQKLPQQLAQKYQ